jgi:hypothetical protein
LFGVKTSIHKTEEIIDPGNNKEFYLNTV